MTGVQTCALPISSNLIPAGMTAEIASNAANLLSDIKPGYMLGAKPRQQAIGHVIGIIAGAVASTPLFYLLFLPPNASGVRSTATLVTEQFAMPAAVQWKGVADLIAKGLGSLPVSAMVAMAIAAIVAVVHDVFITVGIYALVGFDVTPATVIGFLTILGYSLYDTVVVFDKVRENTRAITSTSKQTYTQATNLAVNQTLVRSINTSVIALIPVGSILFVGAGLLGAGTLKDLSLALFIGMIVGAYSSIFIAPPVLAQLREKEPAMIALAKRVNARGTAVVNPVAASGSVQVATATFTDRRGPRNQPKRKGRK